MFANAGIAPTISLLEDGVNSNGDLLPPNLKTINVNLIGCLYTVKLGIHHVRKNSAGGSIVITASGSSFTRFPATDYSIASLFKPTVVIIVTHLTAATTKHAVLGLMRSLTSHLHPTLPIRINAIAPSWTDTGIISRAHLDAIGEGNYQSADVPARSVTLLMADKQRHGELVYSDCGRFVELENGVSGYHAMTARMLGGEGEGEVPAFMRDLAKMDEAKKIELERV